MKKFIDAISGSFYSRRTYAAAALNWRGQGFIFLMVLVLLEALIFSVTLIPEKQKELSGFISHVVEQLPEVRIDDNGNVSVDVELPYRVTLSDNEEGGFQGVIDPRYSSMNVDELLEWMKKNDVIFLVGQKSLFVHEVGKREIRVVDLSERKGTVITREDWNDLQKYVGPLFWASALGYIIIFGYLGYLLSALLLGGIGMIINKISGGGLDYVALVRIACIAMVPGNLLEDVFLGLLGIHIGKLEWLVLFAYLLFGVRAARDARASNG